MEILEQRVEVLASQAVYDTTIRTNYLPDEIIALRKDGTSESTNPEALRRRKQAVGLGIMGSYLAGRAELEPEVKRLESDLKAANDELQKLRLEQPIFNMSAQTVYGMTLDEVKTLKADRHDLRLALEKANRKLSHIKQTLG